jgi:hypothetical protein
VTAGAAESPAGAQAATTGAVAGLPSTSTGDDASGAALVIAGLAMLGFLLWQRAMLKR